MTREEFETLCRDDVRRTVADNCGRDPLDVALDRRVPHAALVATQVKYLRRARTKLPSYRAAQCILPPRAFEQASSEECAAHKEMSGAAALDLTCGLGVDALALSRRFGRVVTLERDPVLADIAACNLRRLGAGNVEVVCASAEAYLTAATERFDWVYADPDRRSETGRRQVRLEACSPDVLQLRPAIRRCSSRFCLKCSPLFDVDEARRLFPEARIEAVSLGGECKELLVYDDGTGPSLTATALGADSVTLPPDGTAPAPPETFEPTAYGYLFVPDAALQKMRLARRALVGRADMWSGNGFAFARRPVEGVPGRTMEIASVAAFDPKELRRRLRGTGAEVLLRDFPLPLDELYARTGLRPGRQRRLAFTRIAGRMWTIELKNESANHHG